jgi:hypothetical protein
VNKRVDQAGHEDASRALDHLSVFRHCQRSWDNSADDAARHEHIEAFTQRFGIKTCA